MNKPKYSNIIYAYDIETTTYKGFTSHYLSNIQCVDFKCKSLSKQEILKQISKPVFFRKPVEVNNYFEILNNKAETEDLIYIIYIHNLAYEFDFLIKNLPFFRNNFKNENSLFLKSRIPVKIQICNLQFRCSYKLLNQSLENLGKSLGCEKLSIDYSNRYFNFSKLPQIEYEYNARDVTLTLLSVLNECSKWAYIQSVKDIPLTSTGLTRLNNRKISNKKLIQEWCGLCNFQKNYSIDFINFLEFLFQGGYNHANPLYFFVPLEKVASLDIISSYPFSILIRKYPRYFKKYKSKNKLKFLKYYIKKNTTNLNDVLKNFKNPFKFAFLAKVKLQNVKVKMLRNNNIILPLSFSKCHYTRGAEIDNGRIYSARELTTNINEIDYFILEMFYDFDLAECEELYYSNYKKELPDFVLNSCRQYLYEKSTLKKILSKIKNEEVVTFDDFYNDEKKSYIFSEYEIQQYLALQPEEFNDMMNDLYMKSKNKLNAQYGINVEKLLKPEIVYDKEDDECKIIECTEIKDKVYYRDFISGIYITSYSRLTLFVFGMYLINNSNTTLIYSDTDSWKCYGDLIRVKKCVKTYNKLMKTILHNEDLYCIGDFDFEDVYDNFCTLGCKKYIYSQNEKVVATVAGVNKKLLSKAYTSLYQSLNYTFSALCEVGFSPCTILDYSVIKKLVTKYDNTHYTLDVIDENGQAGTVEGVNMIELLDSSYILMDFYKPAMKYYINYCEKLQNRHIEILPTKIYMNNKNKISFKYLDDWKKEVKLYKEHNVYFDNINF